VTTHYQTWSDAERIAKATTDGPTKIGPIETAPCSHGEAYQFRYQWPNGSGGPVDGEVLIVTNPCIGCYALQCLRPGTKRTIR
jgi:hypothetical protein